MHEEKYGERFSSFSLLFNLAHKFFYPIMDMLIQFIEFGMNNCV